MTIGQNSFFVFLFFANFFGYLIAIEFFCDTGTQTAYYIILPCTPFFDKAPKLNSSLIDPEEKIYFPKTC